MTGRDAALAATRGMTIEEAARHLKVRTELVFDARPAGGRTWWSVVDAHAARLVLFELARLQKEARRA